MNPCQWIGLTDTTTQISAEPVSNTTSGNIFPSEHVKKQYTMSENIYRPKTHKSLPFYYVWKQNSTMCGNII